MKRKLSWFMLLGLVLGALVSGCNQNSSQTPATGGMDTNATATNAPSTNAP